LTENKPNEVEIGNLIYTIAVMEMIRDLAAQKAAEIEVGEANLGDRAEEEKGRIADLVTHLENKIAAFKGRLWVAWAMAPQIRHMRGISVGLSARIDQTIGVTIPTMKTTVKIWLTLGQAEGAAQFNASVEDVTNRALQGFANAAKVTIPSVAKALATPALSPLTVMAMCESIAAQADGIIEAIALGQERRAEMDQAMIEGKAMIDESSEKLSQARVDRIVEIAQKAKMAPIQIETSVPAEPVKTGS